MAGGSTEAAVIVEAGEDEVEDALAGQGVRMAEQMQGSQAPVEAIEAEVFGQPVLELVLALRGSVERRRACSGGRAHRVEALDICDVLVDVEAQVGGQGGGAAAGAGDKGHGGRGSGLIRTGRGCRVAGA